MISYGQQIISINTNNMPSVPSGDNFSGNGFSIKANKITIDNVLYEVSNYTNGQYFEVTFRKDSNSDHVLCTMYIAKYDNINKEFTTESIFVSSDINNKDVKCDFARCGEGLLHDGAPNNWSSIVTQIGTQFNMTVSGNNITVVNNPTITNAEGTGNYRYTIEPNNELIIRSNAGYKLDLNNILIQCNGITISSEYGRLSEDETEFSFNTIIDGVTFPPFSTPDYYSLFLLPQMIITVVPIQIPNKDVTNNLINVSNSNTASTIIFNSRYQATLTADAGYYISNVTVTMGGVDITSEVYNNGEIDVPYVTDDLIITAIGTLNPTITNNLTHCSTNNSATTIEYNARYQATITADNNYSLDGARVLITMGGVELFDVYNNGVIDIPNVTGNLVIMIVANEIKTFTFKSMDGNTTYATLNAVRLSTIRFEINGSTRTLIVNNQSFSWVNPIPQGKQLYGLSLTANAERWNIPLNMNVVVNYTESTTFYEVILDEGEQAQTFSLMLYKNSAESHRVDKTNYLEYIATLDGTLRKSCSILNPEIDIEYSDVVNFNYVYISIWNRYYYVTDVVYMNKNLVHLSLKVDVLMSYKNKIYNQRALIGRNEFNYNENVIDNQRIIHNNPVIDVIEGTGNKFNPDQEGNIIVNVVGGS